MKTPSRLLSKAHWVLVCLSLFVLACSEDSSSPRPGAGGVEDAGTIADSGPPREEDGGELGREDAGPVKEDAGAPGKDDAGAPGTDDAGAPGKDDAGADGGATGKDDAGADGGATGKDDAGTDGGATGTDDAGSDGGGPVDAGRPDAGTDAGVDGGEVGTVILGTLSGTLTEAGSPYQVLGNAQGVVTIPRGQVLTVQPGVVLDFKGRPEETQADVHSGSVDDVMNYHKGRVELRVYGGIQVRGTAQKKVTFTSTNPYGWWGMNFYGANSVGNVHPVFEHMVFERVRKNDYNGERDWTRAALWAYYPGPVTILNSVFRDNESAAKCGALDLMFTTGSRVENTVFENNRTLDIDRFGQEGTSAMAGGGAMCVTHGQNSVLRGNTFRANTLVAFRGSQWSTLVVRPFLTWPNPQGTYDLGGGGALHYFQPNNDLLEDNLFESNTVTRGPGAAIYLEDLGTRAVTLRRNRFLYNQAGAGGVVVCNRGSGAVELVLTSDNVFTGNTVNGSPAPTVTGDCTVGSQ
ncbi:right-handed parallel beta-helix repeat-containing protein [Myxococcus fulvus]|uniref:right-handed parallel beta-helix repeat-containing protein n=1 Tax=Myxococcus fulvus TaxID=33 RepID=UPI003B9B5197